MCKHNKENLIKKVFIYFIHFLIFRTDGFSKVKLEKQTSHTQTIIKNVVCVTKDATHIIVMYFLVFYATKKGLCVDCFSNKQHLDILASIRNLQGMGCEGVCAHTRVRCGVTRVHVRAKSLLKHVCEVCAREHF